MGVDKELCPRLNMTRWTSVTNSSSNSSSSTNSTITCDCKPGFLYYTPEDNCYLAYRQGPCFPNHYLIPPDQKNENSTCQLNHCSEDGQVLFRNECVKLNVTSSKSLQLLSVNPNTFELEWTMMQVEPISFILTPVKQLEGVNCPDRGTKRNSMNICKRRL